MQSHLIHRVILLGIFIVLFSGCAGNKPIHVADTTPLYLQFKAKTVCPEPYEKLCKGVFYISTNYYLPIPEEKIIDAFIKGGANLLGVTVSLQASGGKICKSPYNRLCHAARFLSRESGVPEREVIEAFLSGGVKELNLGPYSYYKSPPRKSERKKDVDEEDEDPTSYPGIGISLKQEGDKITVRSVVPGHEADLAGIRREDVITHVNDISVDGMYTWDVVRLIRGDRGKKVRITYVRACDGGLPQTVSVVRWRVTSIARANGRILPGNYVYFDIPNFHLGMAELTKYQLQKYARRMRLNGLIFDLRNNRGGITPQAVLFASFFVEKGVVLHEHRQGRVNVSQVTSKKFLPEMRGVPIAILVNNGTASASEIFAGAMQDHGRGILVGDGRTYGKGIGQFDHRFEDRSSLRLTVYQYQTPLKREVQGIGLRPDVTVRNAAYNSCTDTDTQITAAVKVLKTWNSLSVLE